MSIIRSKSWCEDYVNKDSKDGISNIKFGNNMKKVTVHAGTVAIDQKVIQVVFVMCVLDPLDMLFSFLIDQP